MSFNYLASCYIDHRKIMENLKAISEGAKEIIEFCTINEKEI